MTCLWRDYLRGDKKKDKNHGLGPVEVMEDEEVDDGGVGAAGGEVGAAQQT